MTIPFRAGSKGDRPFRLTVCCQIFADKTTLLLDGLKTGPGKGFINKQLEFLFEHLLVRIIDGQVQLSRAGMSVRDLVVSAVV